MPGFCRRRKTRWLLEAPPGHFWHRGQLIDKEAADDLSEEALYFSHLAKDTRRRCWNAAKANPQAVAVHRLHYRRGRTYRRVWRQVAPGIWVDEGESVLPDRFGLVAMEY